MISSIAKVGQYCYIMSFCITHYECNIRVKTLNNEVHTILKFLMQNTLKFVIDFGRK